MEAPSSSEDAKDWKSEGNREFKAGNYLKAGALYTKGIKADPTNAILFSNRSACLLKLLKMQKALTDAEESIRLKPDWDKGYYRKAAVLEALEKYVEALAAYKKAAELNPDNKEVSDKVRALNKLTRKPAVTGGKQAAGSDLRPKQNGFRHANGSASQPGGAVGKGKDTQPTNNTERRGVNGVEPSGAGQKTATVTGTMVTQDGYRKAKDDLATGEALELTEDRALEFGKNLLDNIAREVYSGKTEVTPCVYFLPGHRAADGTEQHGQVTIKEAFITPETFHQCIAFLKQYGEDTNAHAACLVVSKQDVMYPQVWKMKGFPRQLGNGVFVQLDSVKVRRLWFVRQNGKENAHREPVELSLDYKLLEPVLR